MKKEANKPASWLICDLRQKMHLVRVIIAAVTVSAPAYADMHLRGVLQKDGEYLLSLWDSHLPSKPEWIAVGGTFHGCVVKSYDAEREVVHLQVGAEILEAKLGSSPARISPPRFAASKVVTTQGIRRCALHDATFDESRGFVAGPNVICERPISEIMLAYMRYSAEFPNPFGWSVSKQGSDFRPVEIVKEFCPSCQNAFEKRVAQLKAESPRR